MHLDDKFTPVIGNVWDSPLLDQLRNQGGHTLNAADKQGQTDPGVTGCAFADRELLPAIREYGGIDQELLG